jgi:hypothetical protein
MGGASDLLTHLSHVPVERGTRLAESTAVTLIRVGLLLLLTTVAVPSRAWAQSENRFAIGAEFKTKMAGHEDVRGELGPGLLWRFGEGKPGWGFHWGLNWFDAHLDRSIGDARVELARLKIRPFMAGYGYTYKIKHYTLTAVTLAGYAFSSIKVQDAALTTYRDRLGAIGTTVDVSNTFTLKPELGAWYDISRKVGIHGSAGYIVARPHVTVRNSLGEDRRTIRADQFMVRIGLAYSIF